MVVWAVREDMGDCLGFASAAALRGNTGHAPVVEIPVKAYAF